MKPKLIIVISDLQVPYHDPRYIRSTLNFVRQMRKSKQFDQVEVGQIGDLMDQPEVGRWNKGAAGEYSGTFWKGVKVTRELIAGFGFDWVKVGNHDERVELYIEKYAPALGGPGSEWTLAALLETRGNPDLLRRKPFKMAPGWIAAHGHEGGLNQVAGRTAYGLAQRWNTSVVCGHTHRAGTVSTTVGMGASRRRITGMEIGHGMLESAATYIKSSAPNWQRGFGAFLVDGNKTYDQLIMMHPDCSFTYDGKIWRP